MREAHRGGYGVKSECLWSALLALVACSSSHHTTVQTPASPNPAVGAAVEFRDYRDPGVLVIAVSRADDIFPIQMAIASKAVPGGPVVLLVNDPEVRSSIYERCYSYDLCAALSTGVVRVVETPFSTAWIRDYGPQVVYADPERKVPIVLDSRYHDVRTQRRLEEQRTVVDQQRIEL